MTASNEIPPQETAIYTDLLHVQARLLEARKDTKYSNNKEIYSLYRYVLDKINQLREIRNSKEVLPKSDSPVTHNKVDALIDDIFQLLSLFFVSFGLSNTAPATYASLTTVQRLLEHLGESGVCTSQDLEPIKERLDDISKIIKDEAQAGEDEEEDEEEEKKQDNDSTDEEEREELAETESLNKTTNEEVRLLKFKLAQANSAYNILNERISNVSPEIQALMDKLLAIKYQLLEMLSHAGKLDAEEGRVKRSVSRQTSATKHSVSAKDLTHLAGQLDRLQAECDNELKKLSEKSDSTAAEAALKGLLDDCHDYLNNIQMGADKIDPHLRGTYDKLIDLHSRLANLLVTRRWTLRTVDLYTYQKQLSAIDKSRVDGYFGSKEYKGQSILLYLLRSCYAIIYKLLESSEPVSEALQPLHNQLQTVYRCLLDLKRSGGVKSLRELYPYQMKLTQIDNDAVDGIFKVDGQIPPGQATLTTLLSECFDILHELKMDYYDTCEDTDESTLQDANDKAANVIGTKALQDSNYDYNDVGESEPAEALPEESYNEADDNLADYASSYDSDAASDEEEA